MLKFDAIVFDALKLEAEVEDDKMAGGAMNEMDGKPNGTSKKVSITLTETGKASAEAAKTVLFAMPTNCIGDFEVVVEKENELTEKQSERNDLKAKDSHEHMKDTH